MPRNLSFHLTTPQFLDGSKDVTRRLGWHHLKVGDVLCAIEKGQGLRRGEHVKKLGTIRVVDVRRELLQRMLDDAPYGLVEVRREGFPTNTPEWFVGFFCHSHKCWPFTEVARIEFVRMD